MNNDLIFLPALAHILLIFILYIYLGRVKTRAIREKQVDRKVASLNPKAWPDYVLKVSNNLDNQFASPVLFYTLTIIYYLTGHVNSLLISIMGIYLVTRYLHAYVHVTSNYVPHRYKLFVAGLLILLLLTIWLALKIIGL
jgi:hypothetical protein